MDIIILAVIAAVLLFKLYKVLGDKRFDPGNIRSGSPLTLRQKEPSPPMKIVSPPTPEEVKAREAEQEKKYGSTLWNQIKDFQKADPHFDPDYFIENAKDAFGVIIAAYAKANMAQLEPLVGKTMFSVLQSETERRKAKDETHETTLIAIKLAEIKHIALDKKNARITVRFITEQVNLIKDMRGKIIQGDPSEIDEIKDIWTFERPLQHADAHWILVEAALE